MTQPCRSWVERNRRQYTRLLIPLPAGLTLANRQRRGGRWTGDRFQPAGAAPPLMR